MIIDNLYKKLKGFEPDVPLKTKFGTITDFHKFVDTHYSTLKGNPGNKRFKPYYDRLVMVYEQLKEKQ